MYKILSYSYKKAKELNVSIYPSTRKFKKIKVVDINNNTYHIGDTRYKDYPTYMQENRSVAADRRRLYRLRHTGDTPAEFYAREILW